MASPLTDCILISPIMTLHYIGYWNKPLLGQENYRLKYINDAFHWILNRHRLKPAIWLLRQIHCNLQLTFPLWRDRSGGGMCFISYVIYGNAIYSTGAGVLERCLLDLLIFAWRRLMSSYWAVFFLRWRGSGWFKVVSCISFPVVYLDGNKRGSKALSFRKYE